MCEMRAKLVRLQVFGEIINFDNGQADNPDTPADGGKYTMVSGLLAKHHLIKDTC